MKYGMPLVDAFPRRERKLADILRDSMLEMYRLATRLERKYYKKTTLEDLEICNSGVGQGLPRAEIRPAFDVTPAGSLEQL